MVGFGHEVALVFLVLAAAASALTLFVNELIKFKAKVALLFEWPGSRPRRRNTRRRRDEFDT